MAEGTRFKELEKMVVGLRQHQEQQGKSLEDHQGTLEVLSSKIDVLLDAVNGGIMGHQHDGGRQEQVNHEQMRGMQFRSIKLDFPRFDGNNPTGWIYKMNHYFALYPMPEGQKILMSSFYIKGNALIWFEDAEETGIFYSWSSFLEALQLRFGNSSYDDPMEVFTRLKQSSTVAAYKTQFEVISNQLKGLFENYKLSMFLSGLKDEIRLPVRTLHPQNLNSAFGLAMIQEYICSARGGSKGGSYQASYVPFPVGGNGFDSNVGRKESSVLGRNNNFKASLPVQKVSPAEMKERRKKGLCYFCDEKWNPSHKCKKAKIFVMEGMELFGGEDVQGCELVEDLDEVDMTPAQSEIPEISLHAIAGSLSPRTMRIHGKVLNCSVVILVDTGSTHNFLDPMIAKKVGLEVNAGKQIEVRVANGERMRSEGMVEQLQFHMQGNMFNTDFFLLPLGGCDLVVGMQWLRTLGPVLWDFNGLTISFEQNKKSITIKGMNTTKSELVEDVQICQLTTIERKGMFLQLIQQQQVMVEEEVDTGIQEILKKFSVVFEEPKSLPPKRSHDHKINLKEGTMPISVRPYRYPFVQKIEIEKIVKELLEAGVIRCSQPPFSSPVILVRKADGS